MGVELFLIDLKNMILAKRTAYTLVLIALFALVFALVVKYSTEGLTDAFQNVAHDPEKIFEYNWFENVLKFLLLIVVSFGAFAVCDLEDEGTLGLVLARPASRLEILGRRLAASLTSFSIVFFVGGLLAGGIGVVVVGDMGMSEFMKHWLMTYPLFFFVLSLTFFLSVPLRATTPTVLTSFGISLVLSFTYTFALMGNSGPPSIYNPTAFGYRVISDLPLGDAFWVIAISTIVLYVAGIIWFKKTDI